MPRYCRQPGCRNLIETGQYCKEHKRKQRLTNRYYSKNKSFYKSNEWKALADYVRYRDQYKCTICGKPVFGRDSQVDHIKPIWLNPNLRLDVDNLRLVCSRCHPKVEYQARNQNEIDLKKSFDPSNDF